MTIDTQEFCEELQNIGFELFCGVPDSLLRDFCAYLSDDLNKLQNVITANEGNAVGMACGYHVATGKAAVVYMQNSGEGNAVNPLLSLADPDVYGIPMLLLIGWRGEPGIPDEPQHVKQGKVTLSLLEVMGIPYEVLNPSIWEEQLQRVVSEMVMGSRPVALVVSKGTFSRWSIESDRSDSLLSREDVLRVILERVGPDDLLVSTTGKESREVFELRETRGETHDQDFLAVGGMGHTLSIAFGMALGQPSKVIWCLDGDGSMLMHLGSLATYGQVWPSNLRYIVNVNGVHESVGGQPNAARTLDVTSLLHACGLNRVTGASRRSEITKGMGQLNTGEIQALVIHTRQGSRDDLGRPTLSPAENKRAIMQRVGVRPV